MSTIEPPKKDKPKLLGGKSRSGYRDGYQAGLEAAIRVLTAIRDQAAVAQQTAAETVRAAYSGRMRAANAAIKELRQLLSK